MIGILILYSNSLFILFDIINQVPFIKRLVGTVGSSISAEAAIPPKGRNKKPEEITQSISGGGGKLKEACSITLFLVVEE